MTDTTIQVMMKVTREEKLRAMIRVANLFLNKNT
jgi:hypothetical protein